MNPKQIFDNCDELREFNADCKELLDKLMAIKTPMSFDDDFATDAELQALEDELDRMAAQIPQAVNIKQIILNLPAVRATKINFI